MAFTEPFYVNENKNKQCSLEAPSSNRIVDAPDIFIVLFSTRKNEYLELPKCRIIIK